MEIKAAQFEVRRAYMRGGPGAVVSGLVWLMAGFVLVSMVCRSVSLRCLSAASSSSLTAMVLRYSFEETMCHPKIQPV